MVRIIFVAFCGILLHFASGKHYEKCELARELIHDHGLPAEQINDCKKLFN